MEFSERLLKAIVYCFDYSKGTLWIVKDHIWDWAIEGFVKKRKEHPAISLGIIDEPNTLEAVIPMLIGCSSRDSRSPNLEVSDTFSDSIRKKKLTYYAIKPHQLPLRELAGRKPNIRPNDHKTILTDDEFKQLNRYLRSRGVNL